MTELSLFAKNNELLLIIFYYYYYYILLLIMILLLVLLLSLLLLFIYLTLKTKTCKSCVSLKIATFNKHANWRQRSNKTLLYWVDKFLSRRPIFRGRAILFARPIGYTKSGCSKPKCTSDRNTTRKIALCPLLPK